MTVCCLLYITVLFLKKVEVERRTSMQKKSNLRAATERITDDSLMRFADN